LSGAGAEPVLDWVSRYQKRKPIWILLKHKTVSGNGIKPAPHHSVFIGRMPFLPPYQQRQSTEGKQ